MIFEVAGKNHIRIKTSDNPDNFEITRRIISARAKYRAEQREEFPETPSGMMFETVAHKKAFNATPNGLQIWKISRKHENPADLEKGDSEEKVSKSLGRIFYPYMDRIEQMNIKNSAALETRKS